MCLNVMDGVSVGKVLVGVKTIKEAIVAANVAP